MGDDEPMSRREFVRRHHPDHGGDPAVFVAGLRRFDRPAGHQPRVVAVRHRAWPARLFLAVIHRRERRHRAARVH
jgi:hypothetical protein